MHPCACARQGHARARQTCIEQATSLCALAGWAQAGRRTQQRSAPHWACRAPSPCAAPAASRGTPARTRPCPGAAPPHRWATRSAAPAPAGTRLSYHNFAELRSQKRGQLTRACALSTVHRSPREEQRQRHVRAPRAVRTLCWPELCPPPQCARRPAASKAQSAALVHPPKRKGCPHRAQLRTRFGTSGSSSSSTGSSPAGSGASAALRRIQQHRSHSRALRTARARADHVAGSIPHAQLPGSGTALAGRQTATLLSSGATCYASAAALDNSADIGRRMPRITHRAAGCFFIARLTSDPSPHRCAHACTRPNTGQFWIERSSQARSSNRLLGDWLNGSQPPNHHTNLKHLLPYQRSVASLKLNWNLTWNPRTAARPQRRC